MTHLGVSQPASFDIGSAQKSHSRESGMDELRVYSSQFEKTSGTRLHQKVYERESKSLEEVLIIARAFVSLENHSKEMDRKEIVLLSEYNGPNPELQPQRGNADSVGDPMSVITNCALQTNPHIIVADKRVTWPSAGRYVGTSALSLLSWREVRVRIEPLETSGSME
ncbi:Putative LOC100892748 [Caligus rogercresseyi]|uniref:LOC100892748 n=1 Tax=Caligus rogercresseyi TaxID=217165 RepID=A0A7T8GYC8_CALRO|nr:Putative LOC100892748 [Caligus rogercresseyi]